MSVVYLKHVREALERLSDPEKQRAQWAGTEVHQLAGPVEAFCGLFDDSCLGDAMELGTVFSSEIDARLMALDELAPNDLLGLCCFSFLPCVMMIHSW